ncbi:MAG TPA: glutathione S-transferase [Rubrobacter sp.]|nr:glutathione S-transferase [Rubrobacter sp.]
MLEVWGRKNSVNVQKVLWCCEELEIPFRRHDVGGLFGKTRGPEYLARNPMGLVPAISDEGFTLWESNTIVRYLSAQYGPGTLWPLDPKQRALADKWMDYQLGTLWPAFKDAFIGLIRTPPGQSDPATIGASVNGTAEVLAVLDAHLKEHEYVAGPSLTMGDVVLGPSVYRWLNMDIDRPQLSSLQDWHAHLEERPAYRRTVMVPFTKEDPARPED